MNGFNKNKAVALAVSTAILAIAASSAQAQATSVEPEVAAAGEIVVTARKRNETIQSVPVAVTAVDRRLLESLRIDRPADLGTLVPGLNLTVSTGASGGQLYLRGIGSADSSPFVEQAVSINIDGLQVSDSRILATGLFDLEQIEVLRGPQALFFGKNSPGGVISVRSADPSSRTEIILSSGYEFVQNQMQFRGIVSGGLTDTLSARLAASYSDQDGRFRIVGVDDPALGAFRSDATRAPESREIFLRGTLLYEPTDAFTARFKLAYTNTRGGNRYASSERIFCPYGAPQAIIPADDCKLNARVFLGQMHPATLEAVTGGDASRPDGFEKLRQYLTSVELEYRVADGLEITSVTGYYNSRQSNQNETSWQPSSLLGNTSLVKAKQFSEELRLSSSWSGPINFNVGAFYEHKSASNFIDVFLSPALIGGTTSARLGLQDSESSGTTYSVFGQVDYDILSAFRLSAGGRYTSEKKDVGISFNGVPVNFEDRAHRWTNFSPEVSLRYRPNNSMMFYASYKRGFKSGGFDAGFNPGLQGVGPFDVRYDPEKVKGFEGGAKLSLFDRALTLNLAAFSYDYSGLQVTIFDPVTVGARIANAAQASVKGVEFEWAWATPVEGLSLNGAINYLDGTYKEYLADCYTGQMAADGCVTVNGRTYQDMSGDPLTFASRWTGNLAFAYKTALANDWTLRFDGSAVYTGKYHAMITDAPGSTQGRTVAVNASASIALPDDRWQLTVRGVDLTNQLRLGQVFEVPLTGGGGLRPDLGTVGAGGRTVMIELRYALR